jgi:hypothetical protein
MFNGHGQYYALHVTVVSSVMVVSFVIIVVAGSHRRWLASSSCIVTSVMPVHCLCGVVIVSVIGIVGCSHGCGWHQHQHHLQSYLRKTTVGVWCQEEMANLCIPPISINGRMWCQCLLVTWIWGHILETNDNIHASHRSEVIHYRDASELGDQTSNGNHEATYLKRKFPKMDGFLPNGDIVSLCISRYAQELPYLKWWTCLKVAESGSRKWMRDFWPGEWWGSGTLKLLRVI